jgi:hypothetical protein
MQRRSLLTLVIIVASLVTAWSASEAQYAKVSVGKNVQVSTARPDDDHFEVIMNADPEHPGRLVACAHLPREKVFTHIVTYRSDDAGKTWRLSHIAGDSIQAGDPMCTFGRNGVLFSVALRRQDWQVHRSADGGTTWSPPLTMTPWIDREWLTVDRTGGKYDGRIYVHGTIYPKAFDDSSSITGMAVYRSTDNGVTFTGPVMSLSLNRRWIIGPGNGGVLSDGTFILPFPETNSISTLLGQPADEANAALKVITSSDGGEHFNKAVKVADWRFCQNPTNNLPPSLAVDETKGAYKDRVYLVWSDGVPNKRCRIALSFSDDKGKTWSRALSVSDDLPSQSGAAWNHHMPTVVVNKDGVVGILWYDHRGDSTDAGWTVRFRASTDGGLTFGPSVQVSEVTSKPGWSEKHSIFSAWTRATSGERGGIDVSIGSNFEFSGGDTGGLAADASGVFHSLWTDSRSGAVQLWTAPITVAGAAIKNGDISLASLTDVSDKVEVIVANPTYDSRARTVSADISVKNTSKDTVRGPMKLRIISIGSAYASAAAVGTENKLEGVGGIWDFTAQLSGGTLLPGSTSGVRRLTIKLTDPKPIVPLPRTGSPPSGFASFNVRVLSNITAATVAR